MGCNCGKKHSVMSKKRAEALVAQEQQQQEQQTQTTDAKAVDSVESKMQNLERRFTRTGANGKKRLASRSK